MIAACTLTVLGVYLGLGALFSVPFVLTGAGKIDPHAARGTWGFRLLIIPGSILLWPLLARRWLQGVHQPPEESNAHRVGAQIAATSCGRSRSGAPPQEHGPSDPHTHP